MSEYEFDNITDIETVNLKFAYYRVARDVFFRLQEKRGRGEKINFKERGNDHVFTSATRELTPDELRQFCGSGYFLAEHLAGRTAVDWSFVSIAPDVQMSPGATSSTATPAAAQLTTPAAAEGSSASSINATTETIRATKELLKEVAPAPPAPAPGVTREDVSRMLDEKIERLAERLQRAPSEASAEKPRTLVEQAREIKEAAEVLGISQQQQQQQSADPITNFLAMFDRMQELTERVAPRAVGEDASGIEKFSAAVDAIGRNAPTILSAIVPMLPARMQALLAGADAADAATAPPAAQNAPQGTQRAPAQAPQQPRDEREAFAIIAHVAAADMTRGRRVGRTADMVEDLTVRFPKLQPFIDQFLALSPGDALSLLEQYLERKDLMSAANAEWCGMLQDELRGDDGDEQADAGDDAPSIINMASQGQAPIS